jgi:hypothetical protein
MTETDRFEADHVVPVSRGGSSMTWNFVVACGPCNRLKGARTGWEFVPIPTTEQRQRFEEIDRLTERRKLAWLERRRLRREALVRRGSGARKRSQTVRLKHQAEQERVRREEDYRRVRGQFERLEKVVDKVIDEVNLGTQNRSSGSGPLSDIEWRIESLLKTHKYWLPQCRRLVRASDSEIREAASRARDEIQGALQQLEMDHRLERT